MTETPLTLVVTFESLTLAALGCYGQDRFETAAIDSIAAEGTVFDHCFATDITAAGRQRERRQRCELLLEASSSSTFQPLLLAEADSDLAKSAELVGWQRVKGTRGLDASFDDHPFIQLATQGCREIQRAATAETPEFLWLHSKGIGRPWLPPRAIVDIYFEDFPEFIPQDLTSEPVCGELWPTYGASLQIIDTGLERLWEQLQEIGTNRKVQFLLLAETGEPIPGRRPSSPFSYGLVEERVHLAAVSWKNFGSTLETGGRIARNQTLCTSLLPYQQLMDEYQLPPKRETNATFEEPWVKTFGENGAISVRNKEGSLHRLKETEMTSEEEQFPDAGFFELPEDRWMLWNRRDENSDAMQELWKGIKTR